MSQFLSETTKMCVTMPLMFYLFLSCCHKSVWLPTISCTYQLHRWCNGLHAHLGCSRSWSQAPVRSNQRL